MRDLFLTPPFDAPDTCLSPPSSAKRRFRLHGPPRSPDTVSGATRAASPSPSPPLPGKPRREGSSPPPARPAPASTSRWPPSAPRPRALTVETGGASAPAEAYVFAGTVPDGQGVPTGEDRARLVEALVEIMGQYGRRPAAEMPALLHGIGIRALGRARARSGAVPVVLGTAHGPGDVETVERDFAYANYFGLEEHRLRHRRFDGTMSDVVGRGVFTSGDAVTVLPFDPRAGTVLMIEQFRAGPYVRQDPRPWSLETVAGRCDRAEPLEETARREAREEAGLELGRIERIAAYYPSPGIMSEYITAFAAEADLSAAGGVHGLAEEHEDIRTIVVPLADALAAAAAGEINNAPLLLSLYWLDRNAARLSAQWLHPPEAPAVARP